MTDEAKPGFPQAGLTTQEAEVRLRAEGHNELPRQGIRTPLRIALEVLREPMLALLLGAGFVYLLIGDIKDALILLVFASMSIIITVVQETRTERVLEALRDLTSPRALVLRDGERKRIPGRDVVRGDIALLGEGDRLPADGVLLEARELMTDESLLTGESAPVRKLATHTVQSPARPGGDDLPYVFSGSLVVRGSGIAEVTATGPRSEIGRIGHSLTQLETEPPQLQAQTRKFVRFFALLGAAVSVLAVLLYGLTRGDWLEALLAGISLGMSLLPEEFPVVLTIFMAMGAWRISQARVLTRRATAIETLGSATVLCTDKTGTLTENRMRIAELRDARGKVLVLDGALAGKLPSSFATIIRQGVLASAPSPFDPMERAFHTLASATGMAGFNSTWELEKTYGLRPTLLAMTHVWRAGKTHEIAAKGAPEAIAALCGLRGRAMTELSNSIDEMAANGLRVLGVARATHKGHAWPESQKSFKFAFAGLVGLEDPLRASVPAAIAECRGAGIRVMMITGDYPATAVAIARKAGLQADEVITGSDLRTMDDEALAARLQHQPVFARIMPEQKLRIVEALKRQGQVVAMTGDGVNDAPSLKAAHIGIAMGERGTDVAREASSIVLLDDDFSSVVKAVRLGRRIYDNLRKASGFIFAIHMPIAGLAILPLVLNLPIILGPMHIAFLEMIIDPVCTLVFEAEEEEANIMREPPRPPRESLFSRALIRWSLAQGAVAFTVAAAIFLTANQWGVDEATVRALTFVSLVMVIISLVLVDRSYSSSLWTAVARPNRALAIVLAILAAVLVFVLTLPAARDLFKFSALNISQLAIAFGAGIAVLLLLEMVKPLLRTTRR